MEVQKIMYRIANNLVNELVWQLERNGNIDTGDLKNSISVTFRGTTLIIEMAEQGKYIEFGCFFDKNTKIKGKEGFKSINKIKVGEKVWTGKEYKKIIQKEKIEVGYPINKIIIKTKKNKLELTEDHPVWTSKGWKVAGKLKKGDKIRCL